VITYLSLLTVLISTMVPHHGHNQSTKLLRQHPTLMVILLDWSVASSLTHAGGSRRTRTAAAAVAVAACVVTVTDLGACCWKAWHQRAAIKKLRIVMLGFGDRKGSLNEGQAPNFRVVRVALGTGYYPGEGNRRVSQAISYPKSLTLRFPTSSSLYSARAGERGGGSRRCGRQATDRWATP
jgi:hypothetical protein